MRKDLSSDADILEAAIAAGLTVQFRPDKLGRLDYVQMSRRESETLIACVRAPTLRDVWANWLLSEAISHD